MHLLYMYSILGRGSFCFNYCLNSAWHGGDQFPIDTPLVLRLVKTHTGKCLFSPELKSYLNHAVKLHDY